jgi:epoxyqueuosine reductase
VPGRPSFLTKLERSGFFGSVVSADHADELGEEVRALHDSGLLDDDLFEAYMIPFATPKLPRSLPHAKSIIVVSYPQPMLSVTFRWKGKEVKAVVPPTYYDAPKVTRLAREALKKAFSPREHKLVRAALPLKLLAVRSGLAKYGRNNITYIPEYGSFHRLTAFYSDYDSPVDYWQEKEALPLCSKCNACLKACPTGAIRKDRFMIKADRCLVFLNEKNATEPFPSWVRPSAHNAIVGCMRCKKACPYNKGHLEWHEDRGDFSEEETELLMMGKFRGSRAAAVEKKLNRLGLDLTIFPRNLKVLLDGENR